MENLEEIALVVTALCYLVRELTRFIKELHKDKITLGQKETWSISAKLGRKKEACAPNTNSKNDDID